MALTLEQIEKAIAKARAQLKVTDKTVYSGGGGRSGGGYSGPNPKHAELVESLIRLEKAKTIAKNIAIKSDPKATPEQKRRAIDTLRTEAGVAKEDMPSFNKEQELLTKDAATFLDLAISDEAIEKNKKDTLASYFSEDAVAETPTSAATKTETPAATEVAGTPAPAPPAPTKPAPIPTKEAVRGLEGDIEAMKSPRKRLREIELEREENELEREEMLLAEEKAAQRQRAYNALTPAQKLELDVRSREQKQAERARAAVSERREQLAADEEYKGMQIASSGSFKRGDVTQYVDPNERAAAQSYFTNRAADIRAGENPEVRAAGGQFTAGPAPTFGDRSLTVVDIDPRYGGGKGVGANPNFAGGVKFGSDPDTMTYEMIGGKPTPVMTVGQAFATQSRGPGINQYEKAGTLPQQLDAMSAYAARDAEIKKKVDQMIGYQITGVLPPEVAKRAEADKKKREAEAAAAASRRNPSAPSQP
jgi:hypothetical protein